MLTSSPSVFGFLCPKPAEVESWDPGVLYEQGFSSISPTKAAMPLASKLQMSDSEILEMRSQKAEKVGFVWKRNLSKILGYFPGIGIFIAIGRVVVYWNADNAWGHIGR